MEWWIGDSVEALWRDGDKWYPGRIDRVHRDAYTVRYDDGDIEDNVPAAMIRALKALIDATREKSGTAAVGATGVAELGSTLEVCGLSAAVFVLCFVRGQHVVLTFSAHIYE